MLTTLLFDKEGSTEVEQFPSTSKRIPASKVLWANLEHASVTEVSQVREAFSIGDRDFSTSQRIEAEPQVHLRNDYIYVCALFPPDSHSRSICRAQVLDCFVGENWLVTSYAGSNAIVDEFRELVTGAGEIGGLDAMSLLATLLELVIVGYSEAFEEIEESLEEFDQKVLASKDRDIESKVDLLVESRARVGLLRRTLAPHRRIFATLTHAELDAVSTDRSATRFSHLVGQVTETLNGARDAREALVNSFDMLILRTEHRTNEIVKVLTLASILFLPGALIAGILGMNVDISASTFASSSLFWGALTLIAAVAIGTLVLAKVRRWV